MIVGSGSGSIPLTSGSGSIPLTGGSGSGTLVSLPHSHRSGFRIRIHLIRIQSGSRVVMTKNWRRKIQLKKKREKKFGSNYKLPSLSLHKKRPKLQKKPAALKREHPALPNMKFINFFFYCGSFLPSWLTRLNPDPISDLDPQPCHRLPYLIVNRHSIMYCTVPSNSRRFNESKSQVLTGRFTELRDRTIFRADSYLNSLDSAYPDSNIL